MVSIFMSVLQPHIPLCLLQVLDPSTKRLLIQNAAKAYELASRGLPDEWLYACYSGKLQAKLGKLLGYVRGDMMWSHAVQYSLGFLKAFLHLNDVEDHGLSMCDYQLKQYDMPKTVLSIY